MLSTSPQGRRKKMLDLNQEEAKKTPLSHRPTNAPFILAVTFRWNFSLNTEFQPRQ